jgi:hypothetical protein
MIDRHSRKLVMNALGAAVDGLVKDLYSETTGGPSMVQEPEITSRICQRVEDRLDGQHIGEYVLRVTAQSMPDRGPRSLEKITGADLVLSVSLDGPDGFDKSLFVQAKYDRNVNREELQEACRQMERHVGQEGTYVWIYEPDGVKVLSSHQIRQMRDNTLEGLSRRSMAGLTGRILDCYAGSQAWGIHASSNRRQIIHERLREVQAKNALDLKLKKLS